ncbi:minor capsid protein [Streptococcus gallolyticus]|uniref:Minor capsid protein n=1 Tax=Streptococcus gallolyticus TaxID=315405 RepID=A0A1H9VAB7_9STRE|nr:minor capsid protein [Streptococcus gallolyticus]SES18177.1 Minor capsid protein [Streptococcus gallolyticus]
MSFRVRTKSDLSGVERKVSSANINKGRYALANQILLDSNNYVPMKDGSLRASGHVESSGEAVSWNTVYARAQYYGTNGIVVFRHYTTPGTGKQWFETAKKGKADTWKRVAAKGMGL